MNFFEKISEWWYGKYTPYEFTEESTIIGVHNERHRSVRLISWFFRWKVLATTGTIIVGAAAIVSAVYAIRTYHNPPQTPQPRLAQPQPPQIPTSTPDPRKSEESNVLDVDIAGDSNTIKLTPGKEDTFIDMSIDGDFGSHVISVPTGVCVHVVISGDHNLICKNKNIDLCQPPRLFSTPVANVICQFSDQRVIPLGCRLLRPSSLPV